MLVIMHLRASLALTVLLAILLVPVLASAQTMVVNAGITTTVDAPYGRGIQKFVDIVNERSKKVKFDLRLFPSGQLGGTRELVESVQTGATHLTVVSTGAVSGFAPSIQVFDFPYLFRDSEHAYKVLDGPIGEKIAKELLSRDIRVVGFFENGWRNLTTSKRPVKTPGDLQGLKIRVMESPVFVESLNAMGGQAVPMQWPEVITSLRSGLIDGQENVICNIWYDKVYEVQRYISLTGHFYNPAVLLMNEKFFQSLPAGVQQIVLDAGKEATAFQRKIMSGLQQKCLGWLVENGMTVEENPDIDAFRKTADAVYAKLGGKFADLIKQIRETK